MKLRPFYAVLEREVVRMIRQRTRLVAAMVRPLIWLLVIGGGFNFLHNLCCRPCGRVDLIYGYRYFNVTDDVVITEDLLTTASLPPVPTGTRREISWTSGSRRSPSSSKLSGSTRSRTPQLMS